MARPAHRHTPIHPFYAMPPDTHNSPCPGHACCQQYHVTVLIKSLPGPHPPGSKQFMNSQSTSQQSYRSLKKAEEMLFSLSVRYRYEPVDRYS